jgi:hypothetical protein
MALQPHRLTQEPVEVGEQASAPPRRLTQEAVEVAYQRMLYRLTQEPAEAAEQVTGASLLRRLTQVVVEVPITQPVHPFGEPYFPEYPQYSPAYFQSPTEHDEHNFASLWGLRGREITLGERGHRVQIRRK